MVWKDYQHPLSIDCANEIDAIISKSRLQWWKMRQKKIIFWTLRLGKKKEKGVKLKDEKKKRQSLLTRAQPDFRALIAQFIILCNYMVW